MDLGLCDRHTDNGTYTGACEGDLSEDSLVELHLSDMHTDY